MALPGTDDRMCITAPADDRKGWTDGPARDPDRVTGSADRHRSRRAPARRVTTSPSPSPRHPLALTAGRPNPGDQPQPNHLRRPRVSPSSPSIVDPPDEATPILLPASLRSCPRDRGDSPGRPPIRQRPRLRHSAYGHACRMTVVPARRRSYGRRGASDGMPTRGADRMDERTRVAAGDAGSRARARSIRAARTARGG